MKPAPFAYHAPSTVPELVELAAEYRESGRVLAGGQSLVPLMNMRRVEVDHLIDINGVSELDRIAADGASVAVGALVRQARALADSTIAEAAPLVVEALANVGSPTVRNRGTVCGNLVFAQPGTELPAVALATGGVAVARATDGEREIGFDHFFAGPFQTALRAGEVVTEVRLQRWGAGTGHAFLEINRMRWPVVSVAVLIELDGDVVSRCAIALSGVVGRPVRATTVEEHLVGAEPSDETVAEAASWATEGLEALEDIHGTPAYRIQVAETLVGRGLRIASGRAERSEK